MADLWKPEECKQSGKFFAKSSLIRTANAAR